MTNRSYSLFVFFLFISTPLLAYSLDKEELPLIFEDDFGKGATHWAPLDPHIWRVIQEGGNHVYQLKDPSVDPNSVQTDYEPPYRSPYYISILDNIVVSDFILQVEAKYIGKIYDHQDLCFFFGWQDNTHFYYAHIGPTSDQYSHTIHIVNEAPRNSIATETNDGNQWLENHYHTIQIIRDTQTGRIEVFFDDLTTPVITANDTTFISGKIGLGSFDDAGQFDNLKLWGKTVTPISNWMLYDF